MTISAKVICDSISPVGKRLTTFELTYPRFIHAEFMTHRQFSRNAASSRAIPTRKMIKMVKENPAMPIFWGKNKKGMSPIEEIERIEDAKSTWLEARDYAIEMALCLKMQGLHKQIVNRIIEPWKHITVICTATEYSNFYSLRRHADAQQEIHELADRMYEAQDKSEPELLTQFTAHMPYIDDEDHKINSRDYDGQSANEMYYQLMNISVARCARVSYLTHDGKRDHFKDHELFGHLLTGSGHGHWSPFEHVATPSLNPLHRSGNFVGWRQYRKEFEGECQ